MSLVVEIKAKARELGFEQAGVARVGPLPRANFLGEWLSRAYQGEMAYMARDPERRSDPAVCDLRAKSVVRLACNDCTGPRPATTCGPGVGMSGRPGSTVL